MQYDLLVFIENGSAFFSGADGAPPSVTVEFGGVSAYSGMDVGLTGVLLPEPSSLGLAGMGLAMVLGTAARRRLRRGAKTMGKK